MRGAQPALRNRRVRIDGALEHDFLEVAGEHAQHDEKVGIAVDDETASLSADGPVISVSLRERRREECQAVAHGVEFEPPCWRTASGRQRHAVGIEIEFRPCVRASGHSFSARATNVSIGVTNLQLHPRLLVPAVFLAMQEVVEEALSSSRP